MYHLWKIIKRNPLLVSNSKKMGEIGTYFMLGTLLLHLYSDVRLYDGQLDIYNSEDDNKALHDHSFVNSIYSKIDSSSSSL